MTGWWLVSDTIGAISPIIPFTSPSSPLTRSAVLDTLLSRLYHQGTTMWEAKRAAFALPLYQIEADTSSWGRHPEA